MFKYFDVLVGLVGFCVFSVVKINLMMGIIIKLLCRKFVFDVKFLCCNDELFSLYRLEFLLKLKD